MGYHPEMPSTSITAITFDAGNTLLYCDPSPAEIYAEALGRHGRRVTADEVEPVFAGTWSDLQERTPTGIDRYNSRPGGEKQWWGAFLREVLRRLEHEAEWQPLLDELYATFSNPQVWKVFPETRTTLEEVRGRGLRMAVISNWDRRLPEILDGLGLTDWFETIVVSAIVGIEKPAPGIFMHALERLDVRAEETLHVGDSPLEDYDGSKAVGMTPVLVDRPGSFAGNGYRRIGRLDEVLSLIE
jgi:putative hydrolase of the HAD superfamily